MSAVLPVLPDIASRVSWARKQKGWSQSTLAERLGVDQTAVSQLEFGKIKRPRYIEELGKELGVSPAWLQFGVSDLEKLTQKGINLALKYEGMGKADKAAVEAIFKKF